MKIGRHYQLGVPFGLGKSESAEPGKASLLSGQVLWSTQGLSRDGVRQLQAAAQAGEATALHLLGLAHFRGQGVEKDLVEARRLQQEAARLGVAEAQFELSLLLAQGLGGKKDARG